MDKLKFKALVGKEKKRVDVTCLQFFYSGKLSHICGNNSKGEFVCCFNDFELYQSRGTKWVRVN